MNYFQIIQMYGMKGLTIKMKITFEINDDEYNDFIGGLNNALNCYGNVVGAYYFGCTNDVPSKIYDFLKDKFGDNEDAKLEFLQNRFNILKKVYKQLEKGGVDEKKL